MSFLKNRASKFNFISNTYRWWCLIYLIVQLVWPCYPDQYVCVRSPFLNPLEFSACNSVTTTHRIAFAFNKASVKNTLYINNTCLWRIPEYNNHLSIKDGHSYLPCAISIVFEFIHNDQMLGWAAPSGVFLTVPSIQGYRVWLKEPDESKKCPSVNALFSLSRKLKTLKIIRPYLA